VFAPLLVLIFWMGFAPQPFLDRMQPALDRTLAMTQIHAARPVALVPAPVAPPAVRAQGGAR
jgi:NADH:ubiquinone oxidoreductase subunit 4 (subunit M)